MRDSQLNRMQRERDDILLRYHINVYYARTNARETAINFTVKLVILILGTILTVTTRNASIQIIVVFEANSMNAMYLYKFSMCVENWIIRWCFRIILFIMTTTDSRVPSLSLGASLVSQEHRMLI